MSQGSLNVPTVGPVSPAAFAGDLNTAVDAIITKNSGATAPTNFPTVGSGATQGQDWFDTSPGAGAVDQRVFDGSSWLNQGRHDTTNHYWIPKWGGGSPVSVNASAGGTVSLAVNSTSVNLISESLSNAITSFGSDALLNIGEMRVVKFSAPGIITYNASSMITPLAADISFNGNDVLIAVYLGTGNWRVLKHHPYNGRNTGDAFDRYGTGAHGGAVRSNALTIGNAASLATERANADTANLFIHLYIQDANLTVSGGRTAPGTTRAAAIVDYNLNKTIAMPDFRGKGAIALDDMGNAAAGVLTGGLFNTGAATTLGSYVGAPTHTLTTAQLAVHTHIQNLHNHGTTDPNHTHLVTSGVAGAGELGTYTQAAAGQKVTSAGSTGLTINNATPTNQNAGSGDAHNNLQPGLLITKYLAL